MNVKQHIRMTASEIAMGRYMRAPDHSAADASFDTAFAEFASPEEKKPADAAATGATGGDAAAGGTGDGSGAAAASGDGSGGAVADSGDGGAGDAGGAEGGAQGAAAAGDGAAAAAADDKGGAAPAGDGKGDAAAGADGGSDAGAGGDAGAAAAAAAPGADAAAAKPADAAPGAAADADAILAGLKKLVGQPAAAEAGAGEGGAAAAAAVEEKPIYTADEQAKLAKYEEDWKDVSEGEALKRRAEYSQLLQHIFTQVANFVKPIQETADVLAQRTFTADVKGAVPDYSDQLRADVVAWAKLQPTYLQVAYNHVIEEGTVDEVKDLVERYRTATGKPAPKPAGAGGAAASKTDDKGNELSDEAKKAAAKLAPVDSKRSGVQAPSDPSDFEDAWKQAAADLG